MVYVMWLSTAAAKSATAAAGPWAKMFSLLGIWHDIHVIAQNNNSDIVFNLFYFIFAFPLLYFHRDSVLDSINLGATRRLEVSSRSGFKECQHSKRRTGRRQCCKCGKFTCAHCGGKRAIKKCQLDTCHFLFKWTRCQPDGAYFMASNRNEYGWCTPLSLSSSLSRPLN